VIVGGAASTTSVVAGSNITVTASGNTYTVTGDAGGGNFPVASSGTYTPTYANAFNITGSVSGNLFYAITPSGADTMVRVWGYVVVNHIITTLAYSGFSFTLPVEAHNFKLNCGVGFVIDLQTTTFFCGLVYTNVGTKTGEVDWNSQVPVSAQSLAINFTYMLNK
jgi:hypothetical protein